MITQRARDRAVVPLSADERDELATAAGSAERANRPAALVVLAGLIFVIACSVLGVAATRQASAASEVERRETEVERIRELIVELRTNEALQAAGPDRLPVRGNFLTPIEEAARQAGIEGNIGLGRSTSDEVEPGIFRVTANYDFRHPRLAELLDWVRRVTENVEGAEVSRVSINPNRSRDEWDFEIRFQRYERSP